MQSFIIKGLLIRGTLTAVVRPTVPLSPFLFLATFVLCEQFLLGLQPLK